MDNRGDHVEYIVCTIDGRRERVRLPVNINWAAPLAAPDWLVRLLVPAGACAGEWRLRPVSVPGVHGPTSTPPTLCLARALTAAAGKTPFDPRQARLKTERLRLEKLNKESD